MNLTEVTIEGRKFKPVKNGTFAHDIWITRKVREAGMSNVGLEEGETQDEFIDRFAARLWESGALLEILGGLLMPSDIEPKDWTPEMAKATSDFFGNVTEDESKKFLRMQAGGVLFYFFATALSSSKTSTKSGPVTGTEVGEHRATEDASITETGA